LDTEKFNRAVALLCPTCGSTQFKSSELMNNETELIKCASCGREFTRDELIRENSENIDEHIKEMGKEVTEELGREIKRQLVKAFKDNKFIKVK
jgi:predicted RNA-binding Zn-ribbon protein involved in translation (DUF1610 family)